MLWITVAIFKCTSSRSLLKSCKTTHQIMKLCEFMRPLKFAWRLGFITICKRDRITPGRVKHIHQHVQQVDVVKYNNGYNCGDLILACSKCDCSIRMADCYKSLQARATGSIINSLLCSVAVTVQYITICESLILGMYLAS